MRVSRAIAAVLMAMPLVVGPTIARAEDGDRAALRQFDIAPQPLASALNALAVQAHVDILFAPEITEGRASGGVSGALSTEAALRQLLAQTDLVATRAPNGMFLIVRADAAGPGSRKASRRARADAERDHGAARAGSWPGGRDQEPNGAEVLVTARKSAERVQDVPLSISVFSALQMSTRGVRGLADIAALTPGLNFEAYIGGSGTAVIRGAAQARITDLDPNVSTFFDNVYLPRQYMVSPGVVGLERIEIMKGPQSALYGRNAFSGAINYVARKPAAQPTGSLEATVGSGQRTDLVAEYGGPLGSDRLSMQVGFGYSRFDGDIDNAHPNAGTEVAGGSDGRLGGWDHRVVHGRLVWRPLDELEVDVGGYHFRIFNESPALVRVHQSAGDTQCGARLPGGRFALYCGELPWRFAPTPGNSVRGEAVVDPRNVGLAMQSTLVRGRIGWQPADALALTYEYGQLDARGVSGGSSDRDPLVGSINPFDPATPGNQWAVSPYTSDDYRQHELRVEFEPGGRWKLMAGIFESRLQDFDRQPLSYGIPLMGTQVPDYFGPGFLLSVASRSTVTASALFGRASLTLARAWRIGVELRHAEEQKSQVNGPTSFDPGVTTQRGQWTQTTPRFTVDYRRSESGLWYASAAKGSRSGGFNTNAFVESQRRFDPEQNWTYEVGAKHELRDGKLLIDAAAFYTDWRDQQVSCAASGAPPASFIPVLVCNGGEARIRGAEMTTTFLPSDHLVATLGVAYHDATYGSRNANPRIAALGYCDDVTCPSNGSVAGRQLARQSRSQASLDLEYRRPLGPGLRVHAGAGVSYKSRQYAEEFNLAWLPARTLVNARLGFTTRTWDAELWAKNLLDLRYPSSVYFIPFATDVQYVPVVGARRTMGLTARYRF